MLLNKNYGIVAREFAGNAKYTQAAVKAMNATVLLQAPGKFFGSAVILGPGKEVRYDKTSKKWSTINTQFTVVVSALHNLLTNADQKNPPLNGNEITWNQDYADQFAKKVKINYGARAADMGWGSKPMDTAAIHGI